MSKMQPNAAHGSFQPNRNAPACPKCATRSQRVGSAVFPFRCSSCGTQFDTEGAMLVRGTLQVAPGAFTQPSSGDEQRTDFSQAEA